MAVTVHDVAKAAGVSASTVSRVFNNNPDIADATAARVRSAAQSLGYKRTSARGRPAAWRTKRTGNIAVLVPDVHREALRTPLMGQVLEGVERVLREKHLNLILAGLEEQERLPSCLEPPQVDGLIIRMGPLFAALEARLPEIPRVWIFEPPAAPLHGDIVHPDNEAVAQLALQYLVARAHRHLAVLDALPAHYAARPRREAFVRGAAALGVTAQVLTRKEGIRELLDEWQALVQRPTGLFIPIGDNHTEDVYRGLRERGVQPCEDVGLVACNNDADRLAALDPRLPNVDIRGDEIGKAATEVLLWRIEHPREPQRRVLITPRLAEEGAKSASRASGTRKP